MEDRLSDLHEKLYVSCLKREKDDRYFLKEATRESMHSLRVIVSFFAKSKAMLMA